jgi:hypothetical protein
MFNKMFAPYLTLDAHIEAFQETKRGLTDKIITDPTLNKAAHEYIDAQTQFAKMLAHNFTELAKYSMDSISDKLFPKNEEVAQAKATRSKKATA